MALTDWAIYRLSDGYIDNVIWFDADTAQYTPPADHGMVDIPGDGSYAGQWSMCGIGWSYINGQFIEPPNPNPITTLSADVTDADTVLPVVSTDGFLTSGYLQIEKEWVSFSGVSGNTFTGVVRGVSGSTAAAHVAGTDVQYFAQAPMAQPQVTGAQTL
jgi:hypothetical protein